MHVFYQVCPRSQQLSKQSTLCRIPLTRQKSMTLVRGFNNLKIERTLEDIFYSSSFKREREKKKKKKGGCGAQLSIGIFHQFVLGVPHLLASKMAPNFLIES